MNLAVLRSIPTGVHFYKHNGLAHLTLSLVDSGRMKLDLRSDELNPAWIIANITSKICFYVGASYFWIQSTEHRLMLKAKSVGAI